MRRNAKPIGEFSTIPRGCAHLGVGERFAEREIAEGNLPVFWVGGWRRIRIADLRRCVESRRVIPKTAAGAAHVARRLEEVLAQEARAGT
jgi:hypothetical protein